MLKFHKHEHLKQSVYFLSYHLGNIWASIIQPYQTEWKSNNMSLTPNQPVPKNSNNIAIHDKLG